jgi:ADP-heptose:LPS heptosyltransferase
MKKILLIQLRELGDTILSTAVLRQLRTLHPTAQIDFLCQPTNACIVEHHPAVANIHLLPRKISARDFVALAWRLNRARYDMVVDLQSLAKTAILTFLSGAKRRMGFRRSWRRGFYTHPFTETTVEYVVTSRLRMLHDERARLDDHALDFCVGERDRQLAADFRQRWFRGPVAAIYGVRQLEDRRWPLENFAAIADRLAERGFQPYLVYGPGEEERAAQLATAMRHPAIANYTPLTLPALKDNLSHCALMVTCDGGPKHVAVAAGIPTVTLYESLKAIAWNPPHAPRHRVVTTAMPDITDEMAASIVGTITPHARIWAIPIEPVWHEVEQVLQLPTAAAA